VAAPPSSSLPVSAAAALAGGVGLVVLTGPALPLSWGLLPAALALTVALGLGRWRATGLSGIDERPDLAATSRARRWSIALLVVLPATVLVAVAARVIAALCVAWPPAIAGLLLCVLGPAVGRRGRPVAAGLAAALALAVVAAAIGLARFEAAGPGARGFAHTGPILGIHPFQSTAIAIDGFGPFDLPINDYVEPDGSRGYGPAALAEALQRDLAAIAELKFGQGPARAYQAFAGARVEAVELPAIQERLDRPIEPGTREPRLIVWSGTTGPRSRVEFLCPGSRNDPRPREPDDVMDRMCPDKYTSEASAGLGTTGRWTGYTEGRGVARLSLASALGWSGGSDSHGAATRLWEPRLWAWITLLLLVPAVVWPAGARGIGRAAAGLCGAALAVLTGMFIGTWPSVQVSLLERAAPWASPWRLTQWSPALAVLLLTSARRDANRAGPMMTAALVGLSTWAVAGALAATLWTGPGGADPQALVVGIAGAVHRQGFADLAAAEGITAAVVVAAMLGLAAALLGPALAVAGRLVAPERGNSFMAAARWLGVAVLVAAAQLVLSRKTIGGAALLTPALALGLAACTGIAALRAGPGRRWRAIDHLLAVGVVVWAAAETWADRSNSFMAAALLVGVVAGVASLIVVVGPRAVRSPEVRPSAAPQA